MGLISRYLSFVETIKALFNVVKEFKVEIGKDQNVQVPPYFPPGIDANPLPNDRVALLKVEETGNYVAVGAFDNFNISTSDEGEIFLYSRDKLTGLPRCVFKLFNTGACQLTNGLATISLDPVGNVSIVAQSVGIAANEWELDGGDLIINNNVSILGVTNFLNEVVMSNNLAVGQNVIAAGTITGTTLIGLIESIVQSVLLSEHVHGGVSSGDQQSGAPVNPE